MIFQAAEGAEDIVFANSEVIVTIRRGFNLRRNFRFLIIELLEDWFANGGGRWARRDDSRFVGFGRGPNARLGVGRFCSPGRRFDFVAELMDLRLESRNLRFQLFGAG